MPHYFLDSSALVKRYRLDTGSAWMLRVSSPPNSLIVARLAHVEVASAIVRRGREAAAVGSALAALDNDMRQIFQVMEFSDLERTVLEQFYIVSADEELNSAAAAEGLQIENPNHYP